ncbi:MAG: hypothetical protein A3I44_02070 [Candidatus Sungbacteria bacterium RIFCSPLOWO2_02_FULL_51_17]|uniref:EamA domain-containing protein n=1 Tax=Candidatus Sungbacteria bacterium RIFCSPHIGHO2_02_FULL_51_29 TaxID=1802273 RepID=A0A1G2KUL7_9BACT|nr:MAG: hypothetical protein A2676_04285 [Candidatus Sungbacteria bacterium RIFCSPHIGHO2_01_FULL_51_22]OHA03150.1 MAG: hypothetical protein A3C16_01750 [Candidatus Sungbacteria bacterium RIFCSPHIGHO2_02_FULL_51_29]OHA04796.1 MAG: hypothetical protein A3B29_03310 [Candidatus Sungbacteria bacterium RIFCSPLOWO2_01_FULL_51_34]OHA11067.1 MAG: hypothetical protein A3I44_02070 [Candidatus Sungbacteria bacterium RIFCSPLOWO2_02_FULL_51_17]
MLGSAILFASYGVWSKMLGHDFGIFYQGWVRSFLVLLVVVPILFVGGLWKKIERRDYGWMLASVLFGVCTQVPIYYAFTHAGIGVASVIFFSAFLLTSYIIGMLCIGERMTLVKILSFFTALLGLLLVFGFSLKIFSALALAAAALNGIASGGEVSLTKKFSDRYSSLQITAYVWFGILITHLPASLLLGERQLVPALSLSWFAMMAYAFSGILGFWAVVEGYKYIDASIGGVIGLLEIVFSIVLGIVLFRESVTVPLVIGSSLIIGAAALPSFALRYVRGGSALPLSEDSGSAGY